MKELKGFAFLKSNSVTHQFSNFYISIPPFMGNLKYPTEAYLELNKVSAMEIFCEKRFIIGDWLRSKYASVLINGGGINGSEKRYLN